MLLSFGAMWFLFFRRRWNERPLLFGVMDYLPWIVPRRTAAKIYRAGWVVLLCYVVVTALAVILSFFYGPNNNQRVLILLLLTPLLVSVGLKIIIRMRRDKDLNIPIVHGEEGILLAPRRAFPRRTPDGPSPSLYAFHRGAGAGDGCCCPPPSLRGYANNQELLQSVKKEQLLMAGALDNRKPVLLQNLHNLDTGLVTTGLYTEWQYHRGIYTLNRDSPRVTDRPMPPAAEAFGVASTYFEGSRLAGERLL